MIDLYLDTANTTLAKEPLSSRAFIGLTTNPLLVEEAGLKEGDFAGLVDFARSMGLRRIFFQAWGRNERELYDNADRLRRMGPEVCVKVPVTVAGLAVARRLVGEGVTVLVTAVYHRKQLLLAEAVGAQFVAPYVGRMNDAGRDGIAETLAMQRMLDASSPTRLLVASLRTVGDVTQLAEGGVTAFAVNPDLGTRLLQDALTDAAVADFERAAQQTAEAAGR